MGDLVSVIIPCYNQGIYLYEALDSVYKQTYQHIEIIVVNDGSTDEKTLEILSSLSNESSIKLLNIQKSNPSVARNFGISKCSGNFFLPLDADDRLHPSFIERTLEILKTSDTIAGVSSWAMQFGAKSGIKTLEGGGIENFLRYNNCTVTALLKKSIWEEIGGYDENMREGFEDWEFYINLTKRGYKIVIIPEPLFYYRIKTKSRNTVALVKRPEIYRYIINKHRDVFDQYYPQIIYELEQDLQKTVQAFMHSTNYRLGNFLLFLPRKILQWIKAFLP
ncbi:MAG: glycosyltransferase family A protein [Bacteroidales bacterium]